MKHNHSILLMDISNSYTKLALFQQGRLGKVQRFKTNSWTPSSCEQILKRLGSPQKILISSVVPRISQIFKQVSPQIHFLSWKSPLKIGIQYPQPSQIGADRLANAVAVHHYYHVPAIVVDFGTAVTFDVMDKNGNYIGGVIAPGLAALTDYLHKNTALLPQIRLQSPKKAIGKNTREAMQIGAITGYVGLIESILKAILKELHSPTTPKPFIVATGGDSRLIVPRIPLIQKTDSKLTLRGLGFIARQIWK